MRNACLSICALLAMILLTTEAQAQQNVAGDWHGALTIPTGQLRLLLTIRQGGGGALTAELESPDQAPGIRFRSRRSPSPTGK